MVIQLEVEQLASAFLLKDKRNACFALIFLQCHHVYILPLTPQAPHHHHQHTFTSLHGMLYHTNEVNSFDILSCLPPRGY